MLRALLILLLLTTPLSSQATTLKIATLAPDGTRWMETMRAGASEVEARTDGRVKLRFYPGGVMGNDNSVLRKIRVGQLHGAALTAGGLSTVYPDIQLYSLPFLFRDNTEVDSVRAVLDPLLIEGLQRQGFVSYGISESGFAYLMSQHPLENVEALQQRRIWTPEGDQISLQAFQTIGISPVPLPLTDVLTGLQTGLIDTVASSPVGAIALQWHTRIRHVADIPLTYLYGTLVIREKALGGLSAEDRKTLESVMREHTLQLNRQNREDNRQARQAMQQQGIRFSAPLEQESDSWRQLIERVEKELKSENQLDPGLVDRLFRELDRLRKRTR
ncbi:MAG: TRAP transporter substrate-binding protein DctP [Sedimenticola sp.]|nr:TRAP transporter substrate-binding protein DctP [Sedimenticola sp.]